MLRAIYAVASRRTSQAFAATVLGAIVKTLEQNYTFLKLVQVNEANPSDIITISPELDTVDEASIGKAIEAMIRIVYMDMVGKAGLFFLKELKEQAGETIVSEMRSYGVDLGMLQTEQRFLHRQYRGKSERPAHGSLHNEVSLLGYTWKNVGSWKYDPLQRTCVLYSKDGTELDRLNLETIIEQYVTSLTHEPEEMPETYRSELRLSDKEIELLRMLHSQDMDAETATTLLHVSKQEFETMIRHLLSSELLHYVSYDEIELTEVGLSFIASACPKAA